MYYAELIGSNPPGYSENPCPIPYDHPFPADWIEALHRPCNYRVPVPGCLPVAELAGTPI